MGNQPDKATKNFKVFISYSRNNVEAANQLQAALDSLGYSPKLDLQILAAGDEWKTRLGDQIRSSDAFIFIVSDESITSQMCQWELSEATRLGKKIVPILFSPLKSTDIPEEIAKRNHVFFYSEPSAPTSGFGTGLSRLDDTLCTDIAWIRDATRITELADRWESDKKSKDLLLRGSELSKFQDWQNSKPSGEVIPILVLSFLHESEVSQIRRQNDEQARLKEREDAIFREKQATIKIGRLAKMIAATLIAALILAILTIRISIDREVASTALLAATINQHTSTLNDVERQEYDDAILFALESLNLSRNSVWNTLSRNFFDNNEAEANLTKAYVNSKLEKELSGHTDYVTSVAYTSDGKTILTASFDGKIKFWAANTGKLIKTISGHEKEIYALSINEAGTKFLTSSLDKTAKIWDLETGNIIGTLSGHTDNVMSAKFNSNGSAIVTAARNGEIFVWDSERLEIINRTTKYTRANSAEFNAKGTEIVAAIVSSDQKNCAVILDAFTMLEINRLVGHTDRVIDAEFNKDGTQVLTASWDKTAIIWDVKKSALPLMQFQDHKSALVSATFDQQSRHILTASTDRSAIAWNVTNKKAIARFQGHKDFLTSAQFSPDGKNVVTASRDKMARVWKFTPATPIQEFGPYEDLVSTASLSSSGNKVLTALDDVIKIWDRETNSLIAQLKTPNSEKVETATFFPNDHNKIAAGYSDGTIVIWSTTNEKFLAQAKVSDSPIGSIKLNRSATQLVATMNNGLITIRDSIRLDPVATIPISNSKTNGSEIEISYTAFNPDGTRIIAGSKDGSIFICIINSKKCHHNASAHTSTISQITFSPNGEFFASASHDWTAKLWSMDNEEPVHTFKAHKGPVTTIDFHSNRDTSLIATSSSDETIKLWDTEAGIELYSQPIESSKPSQAIFSIDGDHVILLTSNSTLKVFSLDPYFSFSRRRKIREACELINETGVNTIGYPDQFSKNVVFYLSNRNEKSHLCN